jgi:hypothetical protein
MFPVRAYLVQVAGHPIQFPTNSLPGNVPVESARNSGKCRGFGYRGRLDPTYNGGHSS